MRIVPISQRQLFRFLSIEGEGSVEQNIDLAIDLINAGEEMLNCGRIRYIAKADFRLLAEGAYAFGGLV